MRTRRRLGTARHGRDIRPFAAFTVLFGDLSGRPLTLLAERALLVGQVDLVVAGESIVLFCYKSLPHLSI